MYSVVKNQFQQLCSLTGLLQCMQLNHSVASVESTQLRSSLDKCEAWAYIFWGAMSLEGADGRGANNRYLRTNTIRVHTYVLYICSYIPRTFIHTYINLNYTYITHTHSRGNWEFGICKELLLTLEILHFWANSFRILCF